MIIFFGYKYIYFLSVLFLSPFFFNIKFACYTHSEQIVNIMYNVLNKKSKKTLCFFCLKNFVADII